MSGRIRIVAVDVETVEADAILRSVDSNLEPVALVGRRIEVAAGPELVERLGRIGELPVGGAVATPAGNLPAGFLIHVVVRSGEEPVTEAALRRALLNGLRRATELEVGRLALPPLGTGAGNLDAEASAAVMIATLREHLDASPHPADVVLAVSGEYELEAFRRELERTAAPGGAA